MMVNAQLSLYALVQALLLIIMINAIIISSWALLTTFIIRFACQLVVIVDILSMFNYYCTSSLCMYTYVVLVRKKSLIQVVIISWWSVSNSREWKFKHTLELIFHWSWCFVHGTVLCRYSLQCTHRQSCQVKSQLTAYT